MVKLSPKLTHFPAPEEAPRSHAARPARVVCHRNSHLICHTTCHNDTFDTLCVRASRLRRNIKFPTEIGPIGNCESDSRKCHFEEPLALSRADSGEANVEIRSRNADG